MAAMRPSGVHFRVERNGKFVAVTEPDEVEAVSGSFTSRSLARDLGGESWSRDAGDHLILTNYSERRQFDSDGVAYTRIKIFSVII